MKFKYDLDGYIIIDAIDEDHAKVIHNEIVQYLHNKLLEFYYKNDVSNWKFTLYESPKVKENTNKIKEDTNKDLNVNIFR